MRILLTSFLLIVSHVFCQDIIRQQIETSDGLSSDIVYQVFQDEDKFLWFSTELGVSKYNGFEFINYGFSDGLPDNSIYEIKETSNKVKWFLSGSGDLSYLKANSQKIHSEDSLSFDSFISELIELKNNRIVVSSFGGGVKIKDHNRYYHFTKENGLLSDFVSFIWERNNNVYLLSSKGISRINEDYSIEVVFKFNEDIHFARSCVINSNQDVLFSSKKHIYYFGANDKITQLKNSENIIQKTVNKINLIENRIAISTNIGSFFIELSNDSIRIQESIINDVATTSVLKDHENNLWVTTIGKGAYHLQYNIYKPVGVRQKSYCFNRHKDRLYIGYENFAYGVKSQSNLSYYKIPKNNYSVQNIKSIYNSDDTTWFLIDGGIVIQFEKQNRIQYYRPPSRTFYLYGKDILFGSSFGYTSLKTSFFLDSLQLDNKSSIKTFKNNAKLKLTTNSIASYDNNVLIGTEKGLPHSFKSKNQTY